MCQSTKRDMVRNRGKLKQARNGAGLSPTHSVVKWVDKGTRLLSSPWQQGLGGAASVSGIFAVSKEESMGLHECRQSSQRLQRVDLCISLACLHLTQFNATPQCSTPCMRINETLSFWWFSFRNHEDSMQNIRIYIKLVCEKVGI